MDYPQLSGINLSCSYSGTKVVHNVSITCGGGLVTALVGPNGSGKSTVLNALSRLINYEGSVTLCHGGKCYDTANMARKEFAQHVTLLSQHRPRPGGLSVRDIVEFGRHPHRSRFASFTRDDKEAVNDALELTGLTDLQSRAADQLSGGELQRAWLASCLAQRTEILLLDEPTNHLDLRYQIQIFELLRSIASERHVAIGIVLHDLNHAASLADKIVLLSQGRVYAQGDVDEVLTSDNLSNVYGITIESLTDSYSGRPRLRTCGQSITI